MKRLAGALGALSVAVTAQAQPFAGLHYGQAEAKEVCRVMETPAAAMLVGNHCKDTDTAWGVSIGYRFNPNTALQVSFVDLGDVAAGALLTDGFSVAEMSLAASATGIGLGLNAHAPLSDDLELVAQFGVMHWDVDIGITAAMPGFNFRETWGETGVTPWFGGGAALRLGGAIWARASYRRYLKVADTDIEMLSIGVEYRR